MKWLFRLFSGVALGVLLAHWVRGVSEAHAQSEPQLSISPSLPNRWMPLRLAGATNVVWNLEASRDLLNWKSIATLHALDFVPFWTNPTVVNFHDPAAPEFPRRFYRASIVPLDFTEDWKNQIYFPSDPFASTPHPAQDSPGWVKFSILTNEPARVYYQDSRKYLFHYDFATARLPPLKGIDHQDFDRAALHTNGQQVVLGAVLLPPAARTPEFGVQFVGLDSYLPEQVARWFKV